MTRQISDSEINIVKMTVPYDTNDRIVAGQQLQVVGIGECLLWGGR